MPTLTVSKARQKLGQYVDQAHEGQCIVIVSRARQTFRHRSGEVGQDPVGAGSFYGQQTFISS
ncbi:MAG: type II toxin-antitoxin system prevent-host-death family antitoxin [Pedosphaera sp.]|nr:type II toxin-antitoxin system prevent-host-death family antitoxin [Pedosphaera sp.]